METVDQLLRDLASQLGAFICPEALALKELINLVSQ